MGGENATQEIKLEDIEIKEETVFIKEKDPLGSNEEDTCTFYVQGESLKRESTDIPSKTLLSFFHFIVNYYLHWSGAHEAFQDWWLGILVLSIQAYLVS